MRRIGCSNSLGALIFTCPTTESRKQPVLQLSTINGRPRRRRERRRILPRGGEEEEIKHRSSEGSGENVRGRKQARARERKVKLAQELGLQPRQVAVWFQNRRARWKTKPLERDFGVLKANYEALKANYETLVQDNDVLRKEMKELKGRLQEENRDGYLSVKEEMDPLMAENTNPSTELSRPESDLNGESFKNACNGDDSAGAEAYFFPDNFKDGSSDSDSSANLNEDNSSNVPIFSQEILHSNHLLVSPLPSAFKCNALPRRQNIKLF